MLTQNRRLLRKSALSGDRMAFEFGYSHPLGAIRVSPSLMPRPLMYNVGRVDDSFLSSVLVAFVSMNKSKTEIAASSVTERVQRLALFGPPPVIEGEDAAAYEQLLARICAAVKPVDIIEQIFIADVRFFG